MKSRILQAILLIVLAIVGFALFSASSNDTGTDSPAAYSGPTP